MELILLTDSLNQSTNELVRRRLKKAGYVFLDPDFYIEKNFGDMAVRFEDLMQAKQWCLLDAMKTVDAGQPVVLNSDFVAHEDLKLFYQMACDIEFVDANQVGTWLHNRNLKQANPMAEVFSKLG